MTAVEMAEDRADQSLPAGLVLALASFACFISASFLRL
jgi:hypothetical protein